MKRADTQSDEGFQIYKALSEQGINLEFLKDLQINTVHYREALNHPGEGITEELMPLLRGINELFMVHFLNTEDLYCLYLTGDIGRLLVQEDFFI